MRYRILIVPALTLALAPTTANAQSVMERLKQAAKEALRKAEEKQPPPPPRRTPQPQPTPTPETNGVNPAAKLPASSAKVESTLLAPAEAQMLFYVSPHGGHLAAVTQKGSRFVIVHDGVSGPPFDEIIFSEKQAVTFSPDGTRYSYVGRLGQEHVVMIDGKEVLREPASISTAWDARMGARHLFADFTSNSKHSYFGMQTKKGPRNDFHQLVFDGVPVPSRWAMPKTVAFSADGDHYAYLSDSSSFDMPPSRELQRELIVDGKPTGYLGIDPQFTADGKHLFTRAAGPGGEGVEIFVDGKPYINARDVKLYFAPVGPGVVAVVSPKIVDRLTAFLVIDGKKVAGSDATTISDVFFSPDGKHYAAACETPSHSRFMLIDGKKGLEYKHFMSVTNSSLDPFLIFSPDSSRTAYKAVSGDKTFVIVDGTESDGYPSIASFTFGGKDGRRFGFVGVANSTKEWAVIVDGKKTVRPDARRDLMFSPDGSRYAHTFGLQSAALVVDGVVEEGSVVEPMSNGSHDGVRFLFSPDSKHIVHYGWITADRRMGFFIDGRFVPGRLHGNPTFTPDGRHHFWFELVLNAAGRRAGFAVYVDGRPAYQVDGETDENPNLWTKTPGAWEMGADGVLTLIAREADALKRIRIAPPADTSIDTLLSTAVPIRGRTVSPD
jgi:hypothetical protein